MTDPRHVDDPQEGYYLTRLVKGGAAVPARIWFEDGPRDRETGELVGDQPGFQCLIAGKPDDAEERWTWMGARITEAEYDQRMATLAWAEGTTAAEAQPDQPVDLTKAHPIF